MTTVDTTVTISINPGGESLEELEARVGQALQRAGRHLLSEACRQMETELLQAKGSALRRRKRRGLHLLTRFGWMRLERWHDCPDGPPQVRDGAGRYHYALDPQGRQPTAQAAHPGARSGSLIRSIIRPVGARPRRLQIVRTG